MIEGEVDVWLLGEDGDVKVEMVLKLLVLSLLYRDVFVHEEFGKWCGGLVVECNQTWHVVDYDLAVSRRSEKFPRVYQRWLRVFANHAILFPRGVRSVLSIGSDARQDAFEGPSFNRSRWGNRRNLQPSGNPITDRTTAINASNVPATGWQRARRNRRRKSGESKNRLGSLSNSSVA